MKRTALAVLCLSLVGAIAVVPASADAPLYSTLGPSGQYDATGGWEISGSNYSNQAVGNPFSLGSGATVGDAQLALASVTGNNNPMNVYIESDSGGVPGSIIASLTQVGTIPAFGGGGGLVTFDCSDPACTLAAGAYWLVAVQPDAATSQGWLYSYNDVAANIAVDHTGSPTGLVAAGSQKGNGFEIDGAATPEPSSFLLLGSGLAGLAGMLRRKLRA